MNKQSLLKPKKEEWIGLLLIIATFVVGIIVYPSLPEQVPSHWNIRGEVDDYSSRFWGAFGIPLLNLGLFCLMWVLPLIDPRRQNYRHFSRGYRIFRLAMVLFLTILYGVIISVALGYAVPVNKVVLLCVSLLLLVIGNFMSTFRHNYFVGIKTPWTLASEEVWQKTHRLGAKLFVALGILGIIAAFGPPFLNYVFFAGIMVAVFVPFVYSYLLYRHHLQ